MFSTMNAILFLWWTSIFFICVAYISSLPGCASRHVITSRSEAMALPDWTVTLVATASFFFFAFVCVRHTRKGHALWRKLLCKVMARTEKPLFRIAWVRPDLPRQHRIVSPPRWSHARDTTFLPFLVTEAQQNCNICSHYMLLCQSTKVGYVCWPWNVVQNIHCFIQHSAPQETPTYFDDVFLLLFFMPTN